MLNRGLQDEVNSEFFLSTNQVYRGALSRLNSESVGRKRCEAPDLVQKQDC
jgi:hypothetical protein